MICIPIAADTNAAMMRLLEEAAREPAELFELRLDSLEEEPDVEALVKASFRPVIATCRSVAEGGAFAGGATERRRILSRAAAAGAAYLDAEAADLESLADRNGAILIVSMHDFNSTPDDLRDRVLKMADLPADWVKFAVMANKPSDNIRVFEALRDCPKPAIGIAMGDMGLPSRILGGRFGSRVTFGSLDKGKESAPGQLTANVLAKYYRVNAISEKTAIYGLLGNPVSQSPGYILHNQAYIDSGMDAVYVPFLAEDARDFLNTMPSALGIRGLSVTIPHKHAALAWADAASEEARRIGAANTLIRRESDWLAENTDCLAISQSIWEMALTAGVELEGAAALVLGAGGTSRAAGVALAGFGCAVSVSARNPEKARRLAAEMGWNDVPWESVAGGEWRVVANTTPVGMVPNVGETPFPASGWRKGMIAFDAVHNPRVTRFLREAEEAGAQTVGGDAMFNRQAMGQFLLWTGQEAPDSMKKAVL